MTQWSNWSSNVQVDAHQISRPTSIESVEALVKEALRLGRDVRAIGRGWSLSDVAPTTDFMVDTRGLRGVLAFSQGQKLWGHRIEDRDRVDDPHVEDDPVPANRYQADRSWALVEALRDDVRSSDRRFAHVLAGTTVRELIEALDARALDRPVGNPGPRGAWALNSMGGAAGQTIAGAIATGTHGGDFDSPPMADSVRAIHLVSADGNQRWPTVTVGTTHGSQKIRSAPRRRSRSARA